MSDVVLLRSVVAAVGVLVSTLVVYQAYRGYRRNDSDAMLYLAAGIALLGTANFLLLLAAGRSAGVDVGLETLRQVVDVVGLVLVFYALARA
ncbi:DUF7521 family protein [Haloarchaeobius sp. HRN-SO-5]|uniref:DUF7521 family protein n=1 Tax=Haloarchaeobius sp. HRN-SO-5 TaxID=3446118 RepID=UPI003EB7BF68